MNVSKNCLRHLYFNEIESSKCYTFLPANYLIYNFNFHHYAVRKSVERYLKLIIVLCLTQSRFIRLFCKPVSVCFFIVCLFFTRTEESSDSSRSNSPAPTNEGKIEFITEFGGENSDASEVKGSDKKTVTNKHSRSVYIICYFKSFIYQQVLWPFWQDYGRQFYTTNWRNFMNVLQCSVTWFCGVEVY